MQSDRHNTQTPPGSQSTAAMRELLAEPRRPTARPPPWGQMAQPGVGEGDSKGVGRSARNEKVGADLVRGRHGRADNAVLQLSYLPQVKKQHRLGVSVAILYRVYLINPG